MLLSMVGMRRSASSHFHSEHQPIRGCESVSRRKEHKFKSEVRAILGRFFFFQTCRYVQAFKELGGNMADLDLDPGPLSGCELRQEGQGQVGVCPDLRRKFVLESL